MRSSKNSEKTIWFKYIKPIYEKRKKLKNPKDSRLISIIDNKKHDRLKRLVEKVIDNVKNAEQIFGITKQLNQKVNPDEKIDDMIGELRAAWYLVDRGYKSIVYQKQKIDFICEKDNIKYSVEIKFIRGSNFKTKPVGEGLGYNLSDEASEIEKKLEEKYITAETQIKKYYMDNHIPLIMIVNNNPLLSYLGHNPEIKKWCNSKDIKTIVLTNSSDVYENDPTHNPTT